VKPDKCNADPLAIWQPSCSINTWKHGAPGHRKGEAAGEWCNGSVNEHQQSRNIGTKFTKWKTVRDWRSNATNR
jgi:hypothetical protein